MAGPSIWTAALLQAAAIEACASGDRDGDRDAHPRAGVNEWMGWSR